MRHHHPLKSSESDELFSGIRLIKHLECRGVSPNPCIRQPMAKSKQKLRIERLKMKLHKASYVESLRSKSANQIADELNASSKGFTKSLAWRELRAKVIEKYGAKCMCCGYSPRESKGRIHVDHIKPRKYFPELALEFDNLQVLCGRCNKEKSNRHATDYRAL